MIEKIINILMYLGITLISGYVIWMCNNGDQRIGLAVGSLGALGVILNGKKISEKDPVLSQLLEVLGLAYGSYAIYCGFDLLDKVSITYSVYFEILTHCTFFCLYAFCFYYKVIKTKFTQYVALFGFAIFNFSLLLEVMMNSNWNIVCCILSVLLIMIVHFAEIPTQNISNPSLLKIQSVLKEIFFYEKSNDLGSPQAIALFLAIGFLILFPFVSGFLNFILYFSVLSLFLGLLTVLNNKKLPIIIGFWLSLAKIFNSLFHNINIDKSVWILIGGVSCLVLALTLKQIKKYMESKKNISEYAPKFLLKLKLEDKK